MYIPIAFESVIGEALLQCVWNLTDERTNALLVYETVLYLSPYEAILSRKTLLCMYVCN